MMGLRRNEMTPAARPPVTPPVVERARRRACARELCAWSCWGDADLCRTHLNEELAGMSMSDEEFARITSGVDGGAAAEQE